MVTIHSAIIIHLELQEVIFYGVLDEGNALDETQLQTIFETGRQLLIGEARLVNVGRSQAVLSNHEDILACLHVGDATGTGERLVQKLVARMGKTFKRKYQADIDELGGMQGDHLSGFSSFATDLSELLETFMKESSSQKAASASATGSGSDGKDAGQFTFAPEGGREPARDAGEEPGRNLGGTAGQGAPGTGETPAGSVERFPGGKVPPEMRDEVLFQEYQEIANVYNVEMVDNVISTIKVFVYYNIGKHHELLVDFSDFPCKPEITLPLGWRFILDSSPLHANWDAANPPKVVDLVAEIEALLQEMAPPDTSESNVGAAIGDNAGGDSASSLLADRLFQKSGREDEPATAMPPTPDATPTIIEGDMGARTPLRQMIDAGREEESIPQGSQPIILQDEVPDAIYQESTGPSESPVHSQDDAVEGPTHAGMDGMAGGQGARQAGTGGVDGVDGNGAGSTLGSSTSPFKIKPRFRIDGMEIGTGSTTEPQDLDPMEPPGSNPPEDPPTGNGGTPSIPSDGNDAGRARGDDASSKRSSVLVPAVEEIHDFSPVNVVKKPDLSPATGQAGGANGRKSVSPSQPAGKKANGKGATGKDDGGGDLPFAWGGDEDGDESMEIKPRREIEDFDFKIKKIED
ncbi:hypothetical protein GF325_17360 [Candidatus Bathyarchaeota archaeon]|nr:hypothetical protein [Candidatus Bathyarchaeota archaeon]